MYNTSVYLYTSLSIYRYIFSIAYLVPVCVYMYILVKLFTSSIPIHIYLIVSYLSASQPCLDIVLVCLFLKDIRLYHAERTRSKLGYMGISMYTG